MPRVVDGTSPPSAKVPSQTLAASIRVRPPTSPESAPSIIEFVRRRELNIPWRELMLQAPRLGDSPKRDDQARLKGYFERCWDAARVKYAGTAFEQAKGQAWDNTPCWDEKGEKVDANFVLLHQPSKRRYVLVDPAARPIMFDPQTGGPDPWNAFWNTHRISGSFQVFSSKDESASARSGALYVSREVLSIRDEYRGLMSRQAFATKLGQVAEQRLLAMSGEVWWEDPTQADADLQKFQAFKSVTHKVEQAKRALKERASRLGYVLATSDQEISLPDGTKRNLKEGQLYRSFRRVVVWTTSDVLYKTEVRYGSCGEVEYRRVPEIKTTYHTEEATDYEVVDEVTDPVDERIASLRKSGKTVFIARHSDLGFRCQDGTALSDVMSRCDQDEAFRRNCVVVVPDYDQVVSQDRSYLGAQFFFNPLPGTRPTQFPRLAIREHLSYTMMWVNSELGQLVGSINLAPGEERTVSVSSVFSEEVASTAAFKSTQEASESQSLDLATEMQSEIGKQINESRSESVSAEVSGGFGPFGAKASVTGANTFSLQSFAKDISRVARRAVQNINRRMSQEITTTSSRKTSITQTASRSFTIRNINQGRTLNLLIHQLNNVFKGGLYLREIQIEVTPGAELIAGSALHDTLVYKRNELGEAVEQFAPGRLPVDSVVPPATTKDVDHYWVVFLRELVEVLHREYEVTSLPEVDGEARGAQRDNTLTSANILEFSPPAARVEAITRQEQRNPGVLEEREIAALRAEGLKEWFGDLFSRDLPVGEVGKHFDQLKEVLASVTISTNPLVPDELVVASGGLYMDSLVGAVAATEPYSEHMRVLERQKGQAEVAAVNARTRALYGETGDVHMTSIAVSGREVSLAFDGTIKDDGWALWYRGRKLENKSLVIDGADRRSAHFTWSDAGTPPAEVLKKYLALINANRRIHFVPPEEGDGV